MAAEAGEAHGTPAGPAAWQDAREVRRHVWNPAAPPAQLVGRVSCRAAATAATATMLRRL